MLEPLEDTISELDFTYAHHDEVAEVVALVESAYRGEPSRDGWTTEADLLEGQRIDEEMLSSTLDRPGTHVLLGRRGGELVACCELSRPRTAGDLVPAGEVAEVDPTARALHEERRLDEPPAPAAPDHRDDGIAFFGMFAVQPGLQGNGVGKEFLAEAEAIARREWDAHALELTVIDKRVDMIEWYERRGYERTGTTKEFPYGDPRFGIPARDDLVLVVLRKQLD